MAKKILRRPLLEDKTGLSGSVIYEKINPKSAYYDPTFPKPIQLGKRAVGWLEDEVEAWIAQRKEQTNTTCGSPSKSQTSQEATSPPSSTLVALLSSDWRVVECSNCALWVLQHKAQGDGLGLASWTTARVFTARDKLLEICRSQKINAAPDALKALQKLPATIGA